jgi:hypothetical protein
MLAVNRNFDLIGMLCFSLWLVWRTIAEHGVTVLTAAGHDLILGVPMWAIK